MTSKLTRERIELIAYFHRAMTLPPSHDEIEELARMALATMNSEPVAWTDEEELRDVERSGCGYLFTVKPVTPHADERRIILLYRHAQPAPVVPDGWVMVPKEPTEAMMLHNSGCQHHAWDDPDCAMRQTRRLIWSHMLAAAPQEVKGE